MPVTANLGAVDRTGREVEVTRPFVKGQKTPLSAVTSGTDLYVGIHLDAPGATWDVSCFGLDSGNQLSDDSYFIFFNQPASPEGAIRKLGAQSGDTESFRVVLDQVPGRIGRLAFCAAIDGSGTAAQIRSGHLRLVVGGQEVARYSFTGAEFGSERAIMLADLYRKGVWRFGAVGQGFAGGLADLIRSFGGTVDDEPPRRPAAPRRAARPTSNRRQRRPARRPPVRWRR